MITYLDLRHTIKSSQLMCRRNSYTQIHPHITPKTVHEHTRRANRGVGVTFNHVDMRNGDITLFLDELECPTLAFSLFARPRLVHRRPATSVASVISPPIALGRWTLGCGSCGYTSPISGNSRQVSPFLLVVASWTRVSQLVDPRNLSARERRGPSLRDEKYVHRYPANFSFSSRISWDIFLCG